MFSLFFIVLAVILLFYCICFAIKLWTGCDMREAGMMLHDFVTPDYYLTTDNDFCNEVDTVVRNVIGNERFEKLIALNSTGISPALLFFGETGALPYVAITVQYNDETEKKILETALTNLVKKYLIIHRCSNQILTEWKIRTDLNLPFLQIQYTQNYRQQKILRIHQDEKRNRILSASNDVFDDTESGDIDG